MKDGRIHLAYKPEHAVGPDTGAVVAGGYGCIFVLMTPTGAVLVAQVLLIVSEDG